MRIWRQGNADDEHLRWEREENTADHKNGSTACHSGPYIVHTHSLAIQH